MNLYSSAEAPQLLPPLADHDRAAPTDVSCLQPDESHGAPTGGTHLLTLLSMHLQGSNTRHGVAREDAN
jgi:hypothetical protein